MHGQRHLREQPRADGSAPGELLSATQIVPLHNAVMELTASARPDVARVPIIGGLAKWL
jgi:hypothetical protein